MSKHLMAKFRRTAAGEWASDYQPWGDWRRIKKKDGYTNYNEWHSEATGAPQSTYHHYVAPLENGHELHAWSYRHNERNENYGWSWAIRDPHGDETGHDEDNNMWLDAGGPDGPRTPLDEDEEGLRYPDLPSAVKKAEENYRKLYPIGGAGTGTHDSGVDYSDLNRFMGEGL